MCIKMVKNIKPQKRFPFFVSVRLVRAQCLDRDSIRGKNISIKALFHTEVV